MKYFKKRHFRSVLAVTAALMIPCGFLGSDMHVLPGYAESAHITSMAYFSANDGPVINGSGISEASYGFVMPVFNGGSLSYEDAAEDLSVLVRIGGEWENIDKVSSFAYNSNWGHWYDSGFTGYWFTVAETTEIRLASKSSPDVYLDYTLAFEPIVRQSYVISAAGDTTVKADKKGAVGIVLPKIDGGYADKAELDAFVYEVLNDGKWVSLTDPKSGFSYRANGYSSVNSATQWGYWLDTIYGLWFQPVTEDHVIRVGYPLDGKKGGDCGNNYVTFELIGEPDAPRPSPEDSEPLELGTADDMNIEGWELIWNDEFDGNAISDAKWTNETGYYLGDDPYTWGWGNNELEYYTDSPDNSFIRDGKLVLKLLEEPRSFEQDPDRIAPYSSGKLISRDKFSFKYGRIDFCAKLPTGGGIWPALWLLPNDNVYGTWASSGELDVMESKGRLNDIVYGTIHYGGAWPDNKMTGSEYIFEDGSTYDDGFHIYSCVWEKDRIRWYVDGQCYQSIPYTEWYSAAAPDDPYAPFNEEFYIIMNLAAGGNFDGGLAPDSSSIPSEMLVDFVRVYQAEGDTECSFTDRSASGDINMAYLVRLHNWLLGRTSDGSGLDLDENGVIDVFDLVKARKAVASDKAGGSK